MTLPRRAQISLASTPYYHVIARCERRAFLCGQDSYPGKNFDHRKQWVLKRIAAQSDVFAINVCAYAVMSNHYHLVLHVDSASARRWSDDEVIHRWTRLFRGPTLVQRYIAGDPKPCSAKHCGGHSGCLAQATDRSQLVYALS